MRTFRGVAKRWPELLEPAQLHVQRIVQKLKRDQVVPLEEADLYRRRAADGEVYALRDVRAIRQGSWQEREAKFLG